MNDYIQVEQSNDGRWIAKFATSEITFDGATKEEALVKAEEALQILMSRIQEVTQ